MADYAALWTSSRDKEFQQIKKVKQLTERHLALYMSGVERAHKRSMKKARDQIRDNMVTLEALEQEKEQRARQILATYFKHQRSSEAAARWSSRLKARLSKNRGSPQVSVKDRSSSSLHRRMNDVPSPTPTPSPRERVRPDAVTLPSLQLNGIAISDTEDDADEVSRSILGVEKANQALNVFSGSWTSQNLLGKDTILRNRSPKKMDTLSLPGETGGINTTSMGRRGSNVSQEKVSKQQRPKSPRGRRSPQNGSPREGLGSSGDTTPRRSSTNQEEKKSLPRKADSKVYMTQTFPFVYHSEGEKPCPRYGLFRETTDYDPYMWPPAGRRASKMDSQSRKASVTTEGFKRADIPDRKAFFSRVALAVRVAHALRGE